MLSATPLPYPPIRLLLSAAPDSMNILFCISSCQDARSTIHKMFHRQSLSFLSPQLVAKLLNAIRISFNHGLTSRHVQVYIRCTPLLDSQQVKLGTVFDAFGTQTIIALFKTYEIALDTVHCSISLFIYPAWQNKFNSNHKPPSITANRQQWQTTLQPQP